MFLKLYTSSKITKGFSQAIIIDTQRGFYTAIPNTMYDVIRELENNTIESVENQIDPESNVIFKSYISFLIDNEFAFTTNSPQNFIYHNVSKFINISYMLSPKIRTGI